MQYLISNIDRKISRKTEEEIEIIFTAAKSFGKNKKTKAKENDRFPIY